MSTPTGPTGNETHIRAIVFREGDVYVAQCLEYDISAQGPDIMAVLDRLEVTVDAEFAACEATGKEMKVCICPAPNYYHKLWENRSAQLARVNVPTPMQSPIIEFGLAQAA